MWKLAQPLPDAATQFLLSAFTVQLGLGPSGHTDDRGWFGPRDLGSRSCEKLG